MRFLRAAVLIVLLGGCAGTTDNLVFQTAIEIGTVRLIDQSSEITAEDVQSTVDEIRRKVNLDGTITADELMVAANAAIDFSRLTAYERVLLLRILEAAENRLQTYDDLESVSATAAQILDWAEGAARLAN